MSEFVRGTKRPLNPLFNNANETSQHQQPAKALISAAARSPLSHAAVGLASMMLASTSAAAQEGAAQQRSGAEPATAQSATPSTSTPTTLPHINVRRTQRPPANR